MTPQRFRKEMSATKAKTEIGGGLQIWDVFQALHRCQSRKRWANRLQIQAWNRTLAYFLHTAVKALLMPCTLLDPQSTMHKTWEAECKGDSLPSSSWEEWSQKTRSLFSLVFTQGEYKGGTCTWKWHENRSAVSNSVRMITNTANATYNAVHYHTTRSKKSS